MTQAISKDSKTFFSCLVQKFFQGVGTIGFVVNYDRRLCLRIDIIEP